MSGAAPTPETKTGVCPTHRAVLYHPECSRCNGEGQIETDDDLLFPRGSFERCYSCGGSGRAPWTSCDQCEDEARDQMHYDNEDDT